MKVLGVDFARTTGICLLGRGFEAHPLKLVTVTFPAGSDKEGMRYLHFWDVMEELVHEADVVVFEEPGFFRGRAASQQNSGYRAILMALCELHGRPYASVGVTTLKSYMGVDSKEEMVQTVRSMIEDGTEVEDDNAADAYALAYYASREMEFGHEEVD